MTICAGTKLLVVDTDSNDIASLSSPYPLLLTTLPSAPIPDIVEDEEDDEEDEVEDDEDDEDDDATVLPR